MANINVSYSEMQSACSLIANGRDTIYGELDRLRMRVDQLVQGGFVTDTASKKFGDSYLRFTNGARGTIQALDEVIKFLKVTEETLRETDSRIAAALAA